MDDFFRSQQSPRGDSQMSSAFVSPPRNGPLLPRRFTTDSGRVPTLSSITTPPQRGGAEPQDFAATALEKKRLDYERLREHKRRFEAEIQKLDAQTQQSERELALMQEDLGRYSGHQSEPTTPPEYRETSSGFPTMFSRPNRYSTSSLTSPPGIFNRPNRSGSQLASPQSGFMLSRYAFDDQLPSRSVPGSRRNSDEDEKEEAVRQDPTSHRSTNALNRYSMPVTRSRTYTVDMEDSHNTTGFLFGDEDSKNDSRVTAQGNAESFPTLLRQQGFPHVVSEAFSYNSLTSFLKSSPRSDTSTGWIKVNHLNQQSNMASINSVSGATSQQSSDATTPRTSVRNSIDLKNFNVFEHGAAVTDTPGTTHGMVTPPKLQQSFSAGDVPTVKNPGNANNHAQQHFHNHNASIGRIPAGAMPNRHSRELSGDASARENAYQSLVSTLHPGAVPFNVATTQPQTTGAANPTVTSPSGAGPYFFNGAPYNGVPYSPNATNGNANSYPNSLIMGMQNLNLASNNNNGYAPQNFTGYNPLGYHNASRQQDSQARVIQSRRQLDGEAMARYANLPLEEVMGTIYALCKDQHGCRYLQKQLENRNPQHVHMIWLETNQHVVELMTDPFGNYLIQKLLEFCNDDERTSLIQNASNDLVAIALNTHGTRALQKMIEFVTTPDQIALIVQALNGQVVDLIQDLNGNHVIQKCLNKLSAPDAQFIFQAVGSNVIEVGTHRHGCCVLQRCIDHADGEQKMWLIERITDNAIPLVQDPFGNYVIQYVIDLNTIAFTEPLVKRFRGRISELSRHKFSSNVMEKCLRCASDDAKDLIIEEMLIPGEVDRLLRDSFANYVVQTALEFATATTKARLVDVLRPSLPTIRSTPYGRRIQAKIQAWDNRANHLSSGQTTPSDSTGGQFSIRPENSRPLIHTTAVLSNGINGQGNGLNGLNGGSHRNGTYPASHMIAVPNPEDEEHFHTITSPQHALPGGQQAVPPMPLLPSNTQNGLPAIQQAVQAIHAQHGIPVHQAQPMQAPPQPPRAQQQIHAAQFVSNGNAGFF
ncbi:ARM repeat-containing protein [Thozetella sp. PMI_491]|nr:ARM repeat-containing protein [Thozetella sp. PMI_491]